MSRPVVICKWLIFLGPGAFDIGNGLSLSFFGECDKYGRNSFVAPVRGPLHRAGSSGLWLLTGSFFWRDFERGRTIDRRAIGALTGARSQDLAKGFAPDR